MQRWPGAPAMWSDGDAGGAAELQTDVMRFVAILALCLVAIFALVQAVPLEEPAEQASPAAAVPPAIPIREAMHEAAKSVVAEPPQADPAVRPVPEPAPATAPAASRTPAVPPPAAPPPAAPTVADRPAGTAAPPAAVDAGFTLRFESDDALTALVARGEIGFYAIAGEEARRLHVARGRLEFWRASTPAAVHEMEPGTVPADVAAALARSGHGGNAVRWGVTLPPGLSRDIDRRIRAGGSGDLVIAENGALRQE